jgi:hypothetical protein
VVLLLQDKVTEAVTSVEPAVETLAVLVVAALERKVLITQIKTMVAPEAQV